MIKKRRSLRQPGTRNPRPDRVQDEIFDQEPFFDPEDLVQVKYEMLRKVEVEGAPVSQAAARFGFSRPAFYQARQRLEEEGIIGLVARRPGPKQGHKLSDEVVDALERLLEQQPDLGTTGLVEHLEQEMDLHVHPRSVERALSRHRKKNAARRPPTTREGTGK